MKKKNGLLVVLAGLLAISTASYAQEADVLNPENWKGISTFKNKTSPYQAGISLVEGALKFEGFFPKPAKGDAARTGKRAQYSLPASVLATGDKLVSAEVVFNGEFLNTDDKDSFFAFVFRASNPGLIYFAQPSYSIVFRSTSVDIEKNGKGNPDYSDASYASFPKIGFKLFPVGEPVKITAGVIQKDGIARIIVRINGVELINIPDNKNGLTVKPSPDNIFAIALVGTNREIPGDTNSNSNLTLTSIKTE